MAIFGLEVVIECDNLGPPPPLSQPGWQRGLHAAQCQRRGPQQVSTSTRVAEVAREHGWHPPKSLDSDENFKPEHTLFCRELRFVAIYALFFGDLWA